MAVVFEVVMDVNDNDNEDGSDWQNINFRDLRGPGFIEVGVPE